MDLPRFIVFEKPKGRLLMMRVDIIRRIEEQSHGSSIVYFCDEGTAGLSMVVVMNDVPSIMKKINQAYAE